MFKKLFSKKTLASIGTTAMLLGALTGVASAEEEDEYSKATVRYECTGTVLLVFTEDFEIDVEIRADVPDEVDAEQPFDVLDSSAKVIMDADSLNLLKGKLGWNAFTGQVTKFEVHAVHADNPNQTQTVNVASSKISIPATTVPASGNLEFTVPASGGIDVEFTAGEEGEINLIAGDISAKFNRSGISGLPVTLDVDCSPKAGQDLVLETIQIKE